jgi:molecular chaperone DnaJ
MGADIEVPTLTGRARLKIEPGTQSGTILRMREKGIPRLNSFTKGDQLVRVNVWVPRTLNAQERAALKQMAGFENVSPHDGDTSANSEKSFFHRVRKAFT